MTEATKLAESPIARSPWAWVVVVVACFTMASIAGCSTIGFYSQAVGGQWQLLAAREKVSALLADDEVSAELKARLRTIQDVLEYAQTDLHLPVGDRYSAYVDVERPFLVWNVVAAEEFSTLPLSRCYPVVGCAAYRGYFKREAADQEGARLREKGLDVFVGGVPAYSTLGWFDDPIVSTFAFWPEQNLARLLFHELAHSVVFVADDSQFNEAFATFVGGAGVVEWQSARADPSQKAEPGEDAVSVARSSAVDTDRERLFELLGRVRDRLSELYASGLEAERLRQLKTETFAALSSCYETHRDQLGSGRFDAYMREPFNNARIATVSTYHRWVPAFSQLFRQSESDWPTFYSAVEVLAELPIDDRAERLDELRKHQIAEAGDEYRAEQIQCEAFANHAVDAKLPS